MGGKKSLTFLLCTSGALDNNVQAITFYIKGPYSHGQALAIIGCLVYHSSFYYPLCTNSLSQPLSAAIWLIQHVELVVEPTSW